MHKNLVMNLDQRVKYNILKPLSQEIYRKI